MSFLLYVFLLLSVSERVRVYFSVSLKLVQCRQRSLYNKSKFVVRGKQSKTETKKHRVEGHDDTRKVTSRVECKTGWTDLRSSSEP